MNDRPLKTTLCAPIGILSADLLLRAPHNQAPEKRQAILGSARWHMICASKGFALGRGKKAYDRKQLLASELGHMPRRSNAYYILP